MRQFGIHPTGMQNYFYFKKKISKIVALVICILIIYFPSFLFFGCKDLKKQNAFSHEKDIELGRYLFYDRRLSVNNTRSCGTCHNPQFAFTDGYKRSLGVFADLHQRNTQPLFNLQYLKYFTAADSAILSPLQQMDNPLFNTHPAEMGVKGNEGLILKRVKEDKGYQKLFNDAGKIISWDNIKLSISTFIFTLQSANSPYDKFKNGDTAVLKTSAKAGMQLFFSSVLKCSSCHSGFNFSTPSVTNNNIDTLFYFNTGLYNIDGKGAYPAYDQGLYQLTKNEKDMGKFRVPTLRNLAFTAPYFHDGSAASLSEVIDVYAAGGKKITQGINNGNGIKNPYKHNTINGFNISAADKINLVNFLLSLSDSSFINNPQYQNPFTEDETKKKY
jgi:cytochrome c peroxidase